MQKEQDKSLTIIELARRNNPNTLDINVALEAVHELNT